MKGTMDLTLCLIVKDEELNLSDCLASFCGIYKNLVVVDTGSRDGTVKIAQNFGASVYHFPWVNDFSRARNFTLDKVESEWVMVVDADDRIEPSVKKDLKEELEKIPPDIHGIFLPYVYTQSRGNPGSQAWLPRIWRTSLRYRYTLPVHEYLDIPQEHRAYFKKMPLPLIHKKTPADFAKSFERNLRILQEAVKTNPQQRRFLFYLGHDSKQAGDSRAALYWFDRYIQNPDTHPHELNKVLTGKGLCHLEFGERDDARNAFQQAIKASPHFIDPYLHLGELAMQEKQYEEALNFYFQALQCKPPHTHVFTNMALYDGVAQKKLTQAFETAKNDC